MLTTMSILSRDQGKLSAKPETEAEYFARFATKEPEQKRPSILGALRWPRLTGPKPELAE